MLTKREIEVLCLMCLSDKEISDQLFISIGTVKTHVHNILEKLNCFNRIQAILKGLQDKIITFDMIVLPQRE